MARDQRTPEDLGHLIMVTAATARSSYREAADRLAALGMDRNPPPASFATVYLETWTLPTREGEEAETNGSGAAPLV